MSEDADDRIGYGKPPRNKRFSKGKSGNPKGRPKGARNKPTGARIDELILAEAHRMVEVKADGSRVSMPTAQAIIRSVAVSAIKGDTRAQRIALDSINNAERRKDELRQATFDNAIRYKQNCEQEIAEAQRLGLPRPKFEIDPESIHADPTTGDVDVSTLTAEEEANIARYLNYRCALIDDIFAAAEDLVNETEVEMIEQLKQSIRSNLQTLKKIEKIIGGPFVKSGDGSFDGLDMDVLRNLKNETV